ERRLLADRYQPGDTVARVTHTHFTPTDYNYLYHHGVPEEDVPRPNQPEGETEEGDEDPTGNDCGEEGSLIGCDDRTLGETLPVVDTPYVLTYASDRVPGDQRAFTLAVPVTGADVPELLEGARVSVSYAGYRVTDVVGAEP